MHRGSNLKESGQILVIFVLALTALMGMVALAVDVGLYLNERRELQNAADAAALAGAVELIPGEDDDTTPAERALAAKAKAEEWAELNGFSPDLVTVTTPYEGDEGRIEVIIDTEVPAMFATVLGINSFPVGARAVASVSVGGPIQAAFLILNETECETFNKSGSSNITITGLGGIMVNSGCDPSIRRTGSGSVTAAGIEYFEEGGVTESGSSGSLNPDPVPVVDRVPDPLADVAEPDLVAIGISPDSGGTAEDPSALKLNSGDRTLSPGVYYGGIEVTSSTNVTLLTGIYVMAGGGFQLNGSGTVQTLPGEGEGIMLYNTFNPESDDDDDKDGECDEISLGGGGNFVVDGYPEAPYKDIVFWQDDACTEEMKLRGNGNTIGGVIYLPNAELDLGGGGPLGSIQVIADTVKLSGGDMIVDFTAYIDIPLTSFVRLTE